MSVNFDFYRTFYYVGKYKNITAAAKALFVTQPTVTHAIQAAWNGSLTVLFLSVPKRAFPLHRKAPSFTARLRPPTKRFSKRNKTSKLQKIFPKVLSLSAPVKQHCIIILCRSWQISAGTIPASA